MAKSGEHSGAGLPRRTRGAAVFAPIADICGLMHSVVMSEHESPFQQQLSRNAVETRKIVTGIYGAGPYVAVPALITLPIMAVAGEGDYIIAVLAGLYAALFIYGRHLRRSAEKGSTRRSLGFWIALYSILLACGFAAIAIALLFEPDGWQYIR